MTVEEYAAVAESLAAIKQQITELEATEESLSNALKDGLRHQVIDKDTVKAFGLNTTIRYGGLDDAAIPLLKARGFRDVIVTKEVIDQKGAKELVASGQLTEEEVAPYRKPDSMFFSLPRAK